MSSFPRFPLFVDLTGKPAVVVGGGTVGLRRAAALARCGAAVTVIAPEASGVPEGVRWLRRPYAPGDLKGACLAVAATEDRAVNRAVGREAGALGIPVSVADAPEECTFYFPALCEGSGLMAGLVGDGSDHRRTARAAEAIRACLEEWK